MRTPAATSASIRPAVEVAMTPRSIAMVRMPWTIGKVPAFLMSMRRSRRRPSPSARSSTPSAGVGEAVDQVERSGRGSARLAAHHLDQRLLRLAPAARVARRPRPRRRRSPRFIALPPVVRSMIHAAAAGEAPRSAATRADCGPSRCRGRAGSRSRSSASEKSSRKLREVGLRNRPGQQERRCPGRCARSARRGLPSP